MARVHINSDITKPFSGKDNVVVWLKKVKFVAILQQVDDVASLLPLYLVGDALALNVEIEEDDLKNIRKIEAQLKETFMDNVFMAYRKLTRVRWAGKCLDV